MKQAPLYEKSGEALGKEKEAKDAVKSDEKKVAEMAEKADVTLPKPVVPEDVKTHDREGAPKVVKSKDIDQGDLSTPDTTSPRGMLKHITTHAKDAPNQIKPKHAREGGRGFAEGPAWLH